MLERLHNMCNEYLLIVDGVDSLRKVYETFILEDLDIPKVLKKNGKSSVSEI